MRDSLLVVGELGYGYSFFVPPQDGLFDAGLIERVQAPADDRMDVKAG